MEPTYRPVRTGGPGFTIFVVCFVLAAVLTLGAWVYWRRAAAPAAKPSNAATTPNTNNNPIARASKTLNAVDAANRDGENTADNMQSPSKPQTTAAANTTPTPAKPGGATTGPKLQGIFFSANNASAIINGKSMKVGDEADGIKVLEITKGSVRVQTGSEVRELTIK